MKIKNKKQFGLGLILFVAFWASLIISLLPVFGGKNLLDVTDDLFNSVSKDSSYYIPEVREEAEKNEGNQVAFTTKGKDEAQTQRIKKLFETNGATVATSDKSLKVNGDLGGMMMSVADDSDAMFANNGSAVANKYGYNEKEVMYDWETGLDAAQKDLTRQDQFEDSKAIQETMERAVEPAYNYYGIEASSPRSEFIPIAVALAGYIIYTIWYGYSLLFMFEGWGLKLEH